MRYCRATRLPAAASRVNPRRCRAQHVLRHDRLQKIPLPGSAGFDFEIFATGAARAAFRLSFACNK
jgi:hypothetical protein